MSEISTINALRSALEPVEALRGEHSQLESWVRESFASLEQLHEDLEHREATINQRELELSQRESELNKQDKLASSEPSDSTNANSPTSEQWDELNRRLEEATLKAQCLEQENIEQLEAFEQLEAAAKQLNDELVAARNETSELQQAFARQLETAEIGNDEVASELAALHQAVELQNNAIQSLVDAQLEQSADLSPGQSSMSDPLKEAAAKLKAMRMRHAARKDQETVAVDAESNEAT